MAEVPLLEVREVTRRFEPTLALDRVSFTAYAGSMVGLVGPNGSGKSTLVSSIVGLDRPTSGSILVDGLPAGSSGAKSLVAFAPDELPLPELLTGREYLRLVCDLEARGTGSALELASAFGLGEHLDKLVGSYSHGMKRRLQFSVTLSGHAPLIVLDEPFSGLDLEAMVLLRASLACLVQLGRTALITIHDIATAERECDQVVVLSEGSVVAQGRPADIVARHGLGSLEEVVLHTSGVAEHVRSGIDRLTTSLGAT